MLFHCSRDCLSTLPLRRDSSVSIPTHEVILDIDVFGPQMMRRILGQRDGALIVGADDSWLLVMPFDRFEKHPPPHCFLRCLRSSHLLSLCR